MSCHAAMWISSFKTGKCACVTEDDVNNNASLDNFVKQISISKEHYGSTTGFSSIKTKVRAIFNKPRMGRARGPKSNIKIEFFKT